MARSRARKARSELKNIPYEIFIGALSVLSIVNLVLLYVMHSSEAIQLILYALNALFSAIFLGDFVYRMVTAPSASHYFFRGFGWADLLASLWFPQLKVLRVFRLWRVARLMREVGPRTLWRTLIHDRANSALMTLLLLGILVLEFGSMWILFVEEDAEGANITSASDALWYTVVTISTVGYGDQYPVTNAGRIIGTIIIVVGVGIFGTFTGYLANLFLGPGTKTSDDADASASASPAPSDSASTSLPPVTTEHTATGVAAGGTVGAVTAGAAGATAPARVATPADVAAPADGTSPAPLSTEQLLELLERYERATAELRELVGAAQRTAGGAAADG
ncbi:ion transporter [Microbacterium sp. AZCO]|uniref:ion transporter n=1 Tax=Microbacterium sp. AZCO TaxID=3142976 RepID=UPI0031F450B8